MAISIRKLCVANSPAQFIPCVGPHTVVLEPDDIAPGARIHCVLCGEFVATMEPIDEEE